MISALASLRKPGMMLKLFCAQSSGNKLLESTLVKEDRTKDRVRVQQMTAKFQTSKGAGELVPLIKYFHLRALTVPPSLSLSLRLSHGPKLREFKHGRHGS